MKRIGIAIAGSLCLGIVASDSDARNKGMNMDSSEASTIRGNPSKPVEFVLIGGGKFMMGTNDSGSVSWPIHSVVIKSFEISTTLVTVEQYAECVSKRKCETPPPSNKYCNWGRRGRLRHPINCVSWQDANNFAKFKDARLLSEAEYEYAATSRGKNQPYPWGKEAETCERSVMHGNISPGCDNDSTMPVCSKPRGNTEQGLCDMVGNVWEWMQDTWHDSYAGAPTNGSAREDASSNRVLRGDCLYNKDTVALQDRRRAELPSFRGGGIGFRLARSPRD